MKKNSLYKHRLGKREKFVNKPRKLDRFHSHESEIFRFLLGRYVILAQIVRQYHTTQTGRWMSHFTPTENSSAKNKAVELRNTSASLQNQT